MKLITRVPAGIAGIVDVLDWVSELGTGIDPTISRQSLEKKAREFFMKDCGIIFSKPAV